ncbi:Ig-like domain-containing protein, partial [Ruegeria sp. WL0004]
YTVSDGQGGTDTATVTVTVTPVNDAPVANSDYAITDQNVPVTFNVLANDTDIDGDGLTLASVGSAANGSVSFSGSSVTYTPDADFYGVDTFTYTVSDGKGGTDTATAVVVVGQDVTTLPDDVPVSIIFNPETPGDPPGTFILEVMPTSSTAINLLIAMDSSGSITQNGWNDLVASVSSALDTLAEQFEGSATEVNVFLTSYAASASTIGPFDLVDEHTNLITQLNNLPFQAGSTSWESAFIEAERILSGQSADDANIMYFITDGNPLPHTQDWEGALDTLNANVEVDIEAFAVGPNVTLSNLDIVDSDGVGTTVATPAVIADALGETPLFNAQLIDFSLSLNVDGVDLGEIADENSSALTTSGLNYSVALQDIPNIDSLLGSLNVFYATATFDLDGDTSTTSDQIDIFAGGVIEIAPSTGASALSEPSPQSSEEPIEVPFTMSAASLPVYSQPALSTSVTDSSTSDLQPLTLSDLMDVVPESSDTLTKDNIFDGLNGGNHDPISGINGSQTDAEMIGFFGSYSSLGLEEVATNTLPTT